MLLPTPLMRPAQGRDSPHAGPRGSPGLLPLRTHRWAQPGARGGKDLRAQGQGCGCTVTPGRGVWVADRGPVLTRQTCQKPEP